MASRGAIARLHAKERRKLELMKVASGHRSRLLPGYTAAAAQYELDQMEQADLRAAGMMGGFQSKGIDEAGDEAGGADHI